MPAIEVLGVSHTFPGHPPVASLRDVHLSVENGEFVSIVGPSGCGKSTLLRILAGLLLPTGGEALVEGKRCDGKPGAAAYMPQGGVLLPWLRAMSNATLGARLAGLSTTAAHRRAGELFERFGLGGFEQSWPAELSGGMQQRVALLRTFLMPRSVCLMDEPFGALDAITRADIHRWLEDVWLAERRAVLFVTHDVEEALVLSDRVYIMSKRPGTMVRELTVPFERPRTRSVVASAEFGALKGQLLEALGAASS
jgi:ABC-type nitrate/sulfonate/bicarbonate transport system ATPase subunit